MKNKNFGFTLIELLVVIVIIGILATISTATFKSYFGKARDAERVSAVQNMALMIKVDGADDWNHHKFMYDDTVNVVANAYDYPQLAALFTANDFRLPKGTNNICYLVMTRGAAATDVGDNNEFVVATWGESTSSRTTGTAGPIIDGTGNLVNRLNTTALTAGGGAAGNNTLDAVDFACTAQNQADVVAAILTEVNALNAANNPDIGVANAVKNLKVTDTGTIVLLP